MKSVLRSFPAIAAFAALETIRQPLALLLLTAIALLAALLPMITSHTLGETERMMADASLALHLFVGTLFGGFAACHSLSGEIRRGTAATVLSKPVDRAIFFVAKFVGLALVLFSFSVVSTLAGLISVRAVSEPYSIDFWAVGPLLMFIALAYVAAGAVNFFTRRPFVSDAYRLIVVAMAAAFLVVGALDREGHWQSFGAGYLWPFVSASALVTLVVWLLAALALALASRLETVPTVTICAAAMLLGMMSDYLLGRSATDSRIAAALYAVAPNWQHFWMADALHAGEEVPLRYVAAAAGYAGFYLMGLLGLGIVLFRHTEVKS